MKTQDEATKWLKEEKDFFGFRASAILSYLDFEHAKDFLKEGVTEEDWNKALREDGRMDSDEAVIEVMRDYFDFARRKAIDHRGLSASRSIEKFQAWVWLLGDGNYEKIHWDWYTNYGAPILKEIGDIYGFQYIYPTDDEKNSSWVERENQAFMNMADGKPCEPDCEEGCGR